MPGSDVRVDELLRARFAFQTLIGEDTDGSTIRALEKRKRGVLPAEMFLRVPDLIRKCLGGGLLGHMPCSYALRRLSSPHPQWGWLWRVRAVAEFALNEVGGEVIGFACLRGGLKAQPQTTNVVALSVNRDLGNPFSVLEKHSLVS
jgi:hypothetical protein